VLITGDSGSGKSDLALRLIDDGGTLVADDYVMLSAENGKIIARPPEKIAGKIELREAGILTLPYAQKAALALVVSLSPARSSTRLPEPAFFDCKGLKILLLSLHAFDASCPAKIRLFLAHG
jgi:HPr kinase/phosphorylase